MNPQQPQSLLVGSDLDDHVSGWFLRETGGKDTRLSHCISPFDTVHITLSVFGQVKIFRDFPKQREKRVLFIRFSPSFSIPPCCTVYGSLLSKAMGKAGSDLGKKTEGQRRGILCGFCLLTISVGKLSPHC